MHQFKLIDSSYTVSEAREILLAIINSKIQFHQLKTFSHDIRSGRPEYCGRIKFGSFLLESIHR